MKRKGIALSIETIVILISAVALLAVLMYFILGPGKEGLNQFEIEGKISSGCGQYAQLHEKCDVAISVADMPTYPTAVQELSKNCKLKGIPACDGTSLSTQCLTTCCVLCR